MLVGERVLLHEDRLRRAKGHAAVAGAALGGIGYGIAGLLVHLVHAPAALVGAAAALLAKLLVDPDPELRSRERHFSHLVHLGRHALRNRAGRRPPESRDHGLAGPGHPALLG